MGEESGLNRVRGYRLLVQFLSTWEDAGGEEPGRGNMLKNSVIRRRAETNFSVWCDSLVA